MPKQVALRDPERVACRVAPAMTVLSKIAGPLVTLLDVSGRAVLKLIGQGERSESRVSDEEIQSLMAEAETAGVIEAGERKLISGVMRLADRSVRGAMTPRHEVEWFDVNADAAAVRALLDNTGHSILPAGESIDDIHGVVRIRDMLRAALAGEDLSVRRFVKSAPVIIDTMDSLDVLPVLRDAAIPLALVHDEYGHFEGIVTPANLMEVIIGAGEAPHEEPAAVRLGPERWSLAGSLAADEMAELLGISLPRDRGYQTAAGFLLARLQRREVGRGLAGREALVQAVAQGRQLFGLDLELAGRLENGRHAPFGLGQPLGVELHPVAVAVQVGHGFAGSDAGRFDSVVDALQMGVVAQQLLDLVGGGVQALQGRIVFAVQCGQGLAGAVQQRLRVGQAVVVAADGFPFAGAQFQAVEFARLPGQAFAFLLQGFGVALRGLQRLAGFLPLLPGLLHLARQRLMAALGVEHLALAGSPQQALVRVLAVDVHQLFAQLAQLAQGHRQAVDEGLAARLRVDGAAQDQGVVAVQLVLLQPGPQGCGHIEDRADIGAFAALAQHAGIAARAQRQRQRVHQNRLAGPGFTRKYGEARLELDLGAVDDHEIPDMQGTQHEGSFHVV